MKHRNFSLKPFPADSAPPVEITGRIARRAATLAISYALMGRLAVIDIPAPAAVPARRHELWRETCFEFFLGIKEAPGYWEFNLSPAGYWNVYRFSGYRQGMAEETAITSLPFNVRSRPDSLRLALEVDLAGIVPAGRTLEVGLAAVIKLRGGRVSHWALTHPGPQPDFHRRDGFSLEI